MRYLIWLILALTTFGATAQDLSPNIFYKAPSGEMLPLRMDTVAVSVSTVGNIAYTEMRITIANDSDRQLEGQFFFPLKDGQRVSRFAMQVGDEMREGVVVGKEKGRKVFEAIVNRRIDPGLLEYVRGNSFKARVYPILPNSTKTVIIGYEETLPLDSKGYRYRLPLRFASPIKHFAVTVEATKPQKPPVAEGHYAQKLAFGLQGEAYRAVFAQPNFSADQDLRILFPNPKGEFVQTGGGYFTLVRAIDPPKAKPRTQPKKLCIIWDQSQSAEGRDTKAELALLSRALAAYTQTEELRLVTFNNELRINETFATADELMAKIKGLDYDGGTQLGVLDLGQYDADLCLLFTDGLSNLGDADIRLGDGPIISVNSSATAETAYLRFLANATGGQFIDLTSGMPQNLSALLLDQPYRFLKATYEPGALAEVYPASPITLENGQIHVSGRMLAKGNVPLTLHFGWGDGEVQTQEINIVQNHSSNPMIERIWANQKLTELERSSADSEDERLALATEYGIVTPLTSLIVLDNLEDYRRYQIMPPPSMLAKADLNPSDWQKETKTYHRFEEIPDYLLEKWQARKTWHNKNKWGQGATGQGKELSPDAILEKFEEDHWGVGAALPPMSDSLDDSFDDDGGWGSDGGGYEEEAEPESLKKAVDKSKEEKGKSAKIQLAPWKATSEYVKALQEQPKANRYQHYLKLREAYRSNTGFYADVADFFLHEGDTATALLIASNIAELQLENHEMLRLLASMLKLCNRYDLAVKAHEEVLKYRPDEIQSYRDLALAYEVNGQYQDALNTFNDALLINWAKSSLRSDHQGWGGSESSTPGRAVTGTQEVIFSEINHLIQHHRKELDLSGVDPNIIENLPVDVRVVVDWDSDNFDMDLWVTDPNGEKCYYANKATADLGRYTYDNTTGYGPEEFLVKSASVGEYHVQMNYYGTRSQKILAPVTVTIHFYTFYGTPDEQHEQIVLRLGDKKEVVEGGKLIFELQQAETDNGSEITIQEPPRYLETKLDDEPEQYRIAPGEQYLILTTAAPFEGEIDGRWAEGSSDDTPTLSNQLKWLTLPSLEEAFSHRPDGDSWYVEMKMSGDSLKLLRKDLMKVLNIRTEEADGFGGGRVNYQGIFQYTSEIWSISQKQKLSEQPVWQDSVWTTTTEVQVLMGETDILSSDHYLKYSVEMMDMDNYLVSGIDADDSAKSILKDYAIIDGKTFIIKELLKDFPYERDDTFGGFTGKFVARDSLHILHLPTGKRLDGKLSFGLESHTYLRNPDGMYLVVDGRTIDNGWSDSGMQTGLSSRSIWKMTPDTLQYLGTYQGSQSDDFAMLTPQGYAVGSNKNSSDDWDVRSYGASVYRLGENHPVVKYYQPYQLTSAPHASEKYLVSACRDSTIRLHLMGLGWPDAVHVAGKNTKANTWEMIGYHLYSRTLVINEQPEMTRDGFPQWPLIPYGAARREDGYYQEVAGKKAGKDYDQVIVIGRFDDVWGSSSGLTAYSVAHVLDPEDNPWAKGHGLWWTLTRETSRFEHSWISADGRKIFANVDDAVAVIDLALIEKAEKQYRKKFYKKYAASKHAESSAPLKKLLGWEQKFARKHHPKQVYDLDWIDGSFSSEDYPVTPLEGATYTFDPDMALTFPHRVSPDSRYWVLDRSDLGELMLINTQTLATEKSIPYAGTISAKKPTIHFQENGWLTQMTQHQQGRWVIHLPSGRVSVPDTAKKIGWQMGDEYPKVFDAARAAWLSLPPADERKQRQWDITVMDGKAYQVPVDSSYQPHHIEFVEGKPIMAFDQGVDWVFYDYKAGKRLAKIEVFTSHEEGQHYHTAVMPQARLGLIGLGRKLFLQNWIANTTAASHDLPIEHGILALDYEAGTLVTLHSDYAIRVWNWPETSRKPTWRKTLFPSTDQIKQVKLTQGKSGWEIHAYNSIGEQRHTQVWQLGR